jgi:hypothetical protein
MTTPTPSQQVDPNVTVPAGVKAAIARAESLQAEYKKNLEAAPDPNAPPVTTEGNPPAPAAEAPPPTPEPQPTPAPESFEHKYNSMKGRFDRAQQTIRQMSDRITNLEQLLASRPTTIPAPDAAPTPTRLVTEKEEEEYGTELLSIVGKRAQEVLTPEVIALKQELAEVKSKFVDITRNQSVTARQRMLAEMDSQLPDWRQINVHEDFLAWLDLPDLYSGAIRLDLLKAAFEQNDTPRVLAFFNGFLTEEAALAPRALEPSTSPPAPSAPPARVSLEDLAAPGRAKSAASNAPAAKPVFTRAQISQFFADVAAGKYRGRDKEKNETEAAIFDAQREGRIR